MSPHPHSNHPLYAFLQSDSSSLHDPESTPQFDGISPAERTGSDKIGADRSLNKHLISLITTVQAHSTQLDQMVNHLNSLVRRVESVESIFSDGQEQIQQSVAEFRSDTDKIALQTTDRINLTLQPTLNLFKDSLTAVNRQLEIARSQVTQQNNIQDNQGLLLAKLEKDVHYLTIQANELEPRLLADKNEHLQRIGALQKEFDTLNSSLAPIALMTPLLQAFLESQLRSSSSSKEPSGCCKNSYGQRESLEKTVPRHSSAFNMRCWREGNISDTRSLKLPDTHAGISKVKVMRPKSSDNQGKVRENRPLEDSEVNTVGRTTHNESGDSQITCNQEPEDICNKAEVEQEPTTTQASESQLNLCVKDELHGRGDETDERLGQSLHRLPSLIAPKSMSRSQVRPNSTQPENNMANLAVGLPKAQSRKRTRSRTPMGFDQERIVRSKSIAYAQLRKISSQRTEQDSASGTSISQHRDQSHHKSNQLIEQDQTHSVLYKKPLKKARRPLLLEEHP